MLEKIRPFIADYIGSGQDSFLIDIILLAGIAAAAVAVYYITKWALMLLETVILRSPTHWDDDLLNPRMLRAVSQLSPAIAVNWLLPGLFGDNAESVHWLSSLTSLYILWAMVRILVLLIDNLYGAFLKSAKLKDYAVKGIFDTFKLIFVLIGVIVAISILIGKSPVVIITALGASAAVLMLVFQDTILGLVASIQLTANKLVQRGDWIEDASHDINGEVLEVSLMAVKVKNWDNSVSTIPPYSLVKGSFRNYEPMRSSGGRRVRRAVYIDVNTVRFCTPEQLEALVTEGFAEGGEALEREARTVYLKLLRTYLEKYLRSHKEVNTSLTLMVRQLEPTNAGLPVELYFFVRNVEWTAYEAIAADIFDHVYAVIGKFALSIYQAPAGTDIARAAK